MSLMKLKYFFLGLILLSLNLASPHSHGQGQGQDFNFGTVAIENLTAIDKGDKTALLGLNFKLEKGWKIYWHSAGLGALPPKIEWDNETKAKIASSQILWLYPKKLDILGLKTLGYQGNITLPVEVILKRPATILSGILHYPVCAQVCIPARKSFTVDLQSLIPNQQIITKSMEKIPQYQAKEANLSWHQKTDGTLMIWGDVAGQNLSKIIISTHHYYDFPDTQNNRESSNLQANIALPHIAIPQGERLAVKLTARDRFAKNYIQSDLQASWSRNPPAEYYAQMNVSFALLALALLAGLLMNFMPCVLPVLALKLLPAKPNQKSDLRQNCLYAALGIIIGFQLLAVLFVAIQQFGVASWGQQFQSPLFLLVMIFALTIFTLTSLDLAPLRIPRLRFLDRFGKVSYLQSNLMAKLGAGIIIVWLASACTAPIIGTVILVALASSPAWLFAIFFCLSLGMAMPYLLISASPTMARYFPKSGEWNRILRKAVTVLLSATILWLFWVLSFHFNLLQIMLTIGILSAFIILRIYQKSHPDFLRLLPALTLSALAMMVLIYAAPAPVQKLNDAESLNQSTMAVQAFAPDKINALLAKGKIVIIDVSASWCITCKINESRVWKSDFGKEFLNRDDVVFMRGDWSLPNDEIENFLARHNHFAIPFTMIYHKNNQGGMILPPFLKIKHITDNLPSLTP